MVRKDVDIRDVDMLCINPVSAVHHQLLRCKLLDEVCDFTCPFCRDVLIAKPGSAELIPRLIGKDCGIFGIREIGVRVAVSNQDPDVVLEVIDDCLIVVELLDFRFPVIFSERFR